MYFSSRSTNTRSRIRRTGGTASAVVLLALLASCNGESQVGDGEGGTTGATTGPGTGNSSSSGSGGSNGQAASSGSTAPSGASGTSGGGDPGSGGGDGGSGGGAPAVCPETYSNPLIWEDLPDAEVIRVDDTYYYTASSFHHSPGAPLLRSYDLVHWEYLSHSVPLLDFDPKYDMSRGNSYVNGIWASTLQYRKSNETFYWMGCMHNVGGSWVFTAKSPEGPWEKHRGGRCYYDMGLLIDDDDTMYVAYGNNTISVAQLSADGFSEVKNQMVFQTPGNLSGPLEGSRFYKIDGNYYIFTTQYANGEYVLRSTNGPFGPYELRPFAVKLPYAGAPGSGGSPHQGGIVQTQNGDWYYVAFNDSFPAGRMPVMAPMTWTDGWPSVTLVDGKWGGTYPFPNLPCGSNRVKPPASKETFAEETLSHEWEWNHNPDNTKWSSGAGLTLQTATVTNDLYAARNTLTRRIEGPVSIGTIELDYSKMQNGDVAGLAALRDVSAWIGVKKANGATRVVMTNGVNMNTSWTTTSTGTEVAGADVSGNKIWLRVEANVRTDAGGAQARFSYSTDGARFVSLGNTLNMTKDWQYFLGYRFGIFNYATQSLGGSVNVASFEVTKP
ncbi:glycoside hydrolase 43 family protein [Sorangium sp. So ce1128]